jgi:hypothetical protein
MNSLVKVVIVMSLILSALYFLGYLRFEGLENVQDAPIVNITQEVPSDKEAQSFIDSTEEIDIPFDPRK